MYGRGGVEKEGAEIGTTLGRRDPRMGIGKEQVYSNTFLDRLHDFILRLASFVPRLFLSLSHPAEDRSSGPVFFARWTG